ncbi:hypothetical protein ACQ4PT_005280 [Festuca glaucescens]
MLRSLLPHAMFVPLKDMPTNGGCAERLLYLGTPAVLAFLVFLLFDGGVFLAASAFRDTIIPGESISGNQTLVSKSGAFELGFFSPGPGIHYYLGVRLRNMAGNSPTFWIGDRHVVVTDLPTASLEMFGDSLYIKQNGASLWWSLAGNESSAVVAILLDNGNLVVRGQGNSSLVLWQSFDCPRDALLPGARLGLDRNTGKNISLTFKDVSHSHNSSLSVDASRRNGFLLTTDRHDSRGTFPDWMVSSQDNGSSLLLNHPESPNRPEFLEFRLGQVSLLRWSESDPAANNSTTVGWVPHWIFPSDCKSGGFFCGDFGACSSDGKCGCVDGFVPSYPIEWGLGYFVTGCSRSLPLSCESDGQTEHGDSFAPLDKLQGLPYNAQDEVAGNDQECRAACRSKCYCVAYSYGHGCKLWYHNLYNLSSAARPPYTKIYLRLGSKLSNNKGLQTKGIVLLVTGSIAISSLVLMDGSMASGIDNEKATMDVDDSRWEGFDISSSEDEDEVPSDDDDSIFGDPVSESDNVVVITNSKLTYYGDSDLEDFADEEDVPEQSKSLEGGVSQQSKSEYKSDWTTDLKAKRKQ